MSSEYSESEDGIENLPLREKSKRSRIVRTREDESSGDEEFWNQDFFKGKNDKNKDDYQYERPGTDHSDSDFSDRASQDEGEKDEGEKDEAGRAADLKLLHDERRKAKRQKKNVYKDPLLSLQRKSPGDKRRKSTNREKRAPLRKSTRKKYTVRKSTAAQSEALRHVRVADFVSRRKSRALNAKKPREAFSQAQLLAESEQTEKENAWSLQRLVEVEKSKMAATVKRRKMNGNFTRIQSVPHFKTLTVFGRMRMVDNAFKHEKREDFYTSEQKCETTGEKAIYREPATNRFYRTKEAFDELKRRLASEEIKIFDRKNLFRRSFVIRVKKPAGWEPKPHTKNGEKFGKLGRFKTITFRLQKGNAKRAVRIDLEKLAARCMD